jgi:hypothetical protein
VNGNIRIATVTPLVKKGKLLQQNGLSHDFHDAQNLHRISTRDSVIGKSKRSPTAYTWRRRGGEDV